MICTLNKTDLLNYGIYLGHQLADESVSNFDALVNAIEGDLISGGSENFINYLSATPAVVVQLIASSKFRLGKGYDMNQLRDLSLSFENLDNIKGYLNARELNKNPGPITTEVETSDNFIELEAPNVTNLSEMDPSKPVSFESGLVTSMNDTKDNGDTEVLRDIPYDEFKNEFIDSMDETTNTKFNFFIVNDTFTPIYNPPFHNGNSENFVPSGVVIVVERKDGSRPTVAEIAPKAWKKFKKANPTAPDVPMVVSMDTSRFQARAQARAENKEKADGTPVASTMAAYKRDWEMRDTARTMVKANPQGKIKVEMVHASKGFMPNTPTVVPVIDRFGTEFDINVVDRTNKQFKKGAVVVSIGDNKFSVIPRQIGTDTELADSLDAILATEFDNFEEANKVIQQSLNKLMYTNDNQYFNIHKFGIKYKISYRIVKPEDRGKPKEEKRKIGVPSDIRLGRFNVSKKAIKSGITLYDPKTKKFTPMDAEAYLTFIKARVETDYKKITKGDGTLSMQPVQRHFSFKIVDEKVKPLGDIQKENFQLLLDHLASLKTAGKLTVPGIDQLIAGIKARVADKKISPTQGEQVTKRLGELKKELQKPYVAPAAPKVDPFVDPNQAPAADMTDTAAGQATVTAIVNTPILAPDAKKESAAEKIARLKQKGTTEKPQDLSEVLAAGQLGGVVDYTADIGGEFPFRLDPKTGSIFEVPEPDFELTVAPTGPTAIKVMDAIAAKSGFHKLPDGTVSGVLKVTFDGGIRAYALPNGQEIYIGTNGDPILAEDNEGNPISPEAAVREELSVLGKSQLDDFLKRNC